MSATAKKQPSTLLSTSLLDEDQQAAISRLVEYDHTLLVAGMGAGKTVIAATAIQEMQRDFALGPVLVVAPLRPAKHVWPGEYDAWEHLNPDNVTVIQGSATRRAELVEEHTTVSVINFENLKWLCKNYDIADRFNGLVVDELDYFRATGGETFKAIRKFLPRFKWRVGMTGTPVSEDLLGLFGEMYVVDCGATFGTNRQRYVERYFAPVDYDQRIWRPLPGAEEFIARRAAPNVHVVPDYTHLLPKLTVNYLPVKLSAAAREEYRLLAKTSVLPDVTAANEAVLSQKLQQIAAGFVYTDEDSESDWREIHFAKYHRLRELVATVHTPLVIVYQWRAQLAQLRIMFPEARVLAEDEGAIADWNAGRVPIMLLHPRSAGHGLNLQHGGRRMIWLHPQWSRRMWDQTIARIWRRGQRYPVHVDVLHAPGTVDTLVRGRLEDKAGYHERFLAHLGAL